MKIRPGNDSFVERGMQTFNDDPKNKEMQTVAVTQNVSTSLAFLRHLYMGKCCPWVEGYPIPELIFTERLYEEKWSLLAG